MDIFWILLALSLLNIAIAISGGKDMVRNKTKNIAVLKVTITILLALLIGYLLYLDGLFYAIGQPMTIDKLFH